MSNDFPANSNINIWEDVKYIIHIYKYIYIHTHTCMFNIFILYKYACIYKYMHMQLYYIHSKVDGEVIWHVWGSMSIFYMLTSFLWNALFVSYIFHLFVGSFLSRLGCLYTCCCMALVFFVKWIYILPRPSSFCLLSSCLAKAAYWNQHRELIFWFKLFIYI